MKLALVSRLSVFSFEDNMVRASHTDYFLPKVEIKDYNILNDGGKIFDQPVKKWNKNIWRCYKIATSCLLDYAYFKENYKLMAIDLSKQQALDIDPIIIQQINFAGNL